jgi:toluene monooxygenase system ferredoxin subunit
MSSVTTGQWQEAMPLDDLWEGEMEPVEIGGKNILLVNVDGEIRAYENKCPHQAWALHEGDFDGREITCSRHMWVFDARDGHGVNPDNCRLTGFPCRVSEDGVILVDVG